MKIMVNGELVDATAQQEAEIIAFQASAAANFDTYQLRLQLAIDAKAAEKDYSNAIACASYVTSTNAQWAAEAQAFVAWRDACYEYGYDYLAQVQSGIITQPTIDAFLAGLPELVWP